MRDACSSSNPVHAIASIRLAQLVLCARNTISLQRIIRYTKYHWMNRGVPRKAEPHILYLISGRRLVFHVMLVNPLGNSDGKSDYTKWPIPLVHDWSIGYCLVGGWRSSCPNYICRSHTTRAKHDPTRTAARLFYSLTIVKTKITIC